MLTRVQGPCSSHASTVRVYNGTATPEHSYHPTLRYLPRRNEKFSSHKKLHTNVCISSIQNCQQLGQTCVFCEWINKMWYIHIMDYYSAIKGTNFQYTQQCGWISEELCWVKQARGYLEYGSVWMTFSKRQNYHGREQISNCQGSGLGGTCDHKGIAQESFLRWWNCPISGLCGGGYANLYMYSNL